ncbi:MAG: hypothetical protein QF535_17085, partial [Anaerolineales bacterium]|nr:hypothetical protein [Anaerolineales bacterium]
LVATDAMEVVGILDIGEAVTPPDDSISTAKIQDDAVTTAKIEDDAVTADKLANSINTEIAANTAKVTNATHTGDVTGATALTIATGAVDIAMLSATGTADATTFLRGDNAWVEAGGGKVLQVVQAVKTDTFSTTSGTFVDVTGLSVSITPSSTSSKILVFANVWGASTYYTAHIGLFRDSTELGLADAASNRPRSLMDYVADPTMQGTHGQQNCVTAHYLDSPSSTSSLTYKIKTARRYDNSTGPTSYINRSVPDRDTSTYDARKSSVITAMEIAE